MAAEDPAAAAQAYRLFARREARGRSAAYEALAESVAGDDVVTGFVASLPAGKRQPGLLFAAARYLGGACRTSGGCGTWSPGRGRSLSR